MIRFNLALTKYQTRLLQRLAHKRQIRMTDVIRQLILEEAIRQNCAVARPRYGERNDDRREG